MSAGSSGFTGRFYLEKLLEDEWRESLDGRVYDVQKPYIRAAIRDNIPRLDQFSGDIVLITDGGPASREPKGAGWDHEGAEELTTIDIRTSHSPERLLGVRTDDNEPERYGGLQGEVKRILDSVRKGDQEFDLIEGYEWNNLSGDVGYQFWRGTWEVRLTQIANNIDPEP